jgi:hypothetical protein
MPATAGLVGTAEALCFHRRLMESGLCAAVASFAKGAYHGSHEGFGRRGPSGSSLDSHSKH